MVDVESIIQKLERNEKIILIVSESLPHFSASTSSEARTTNPTPTTPRRLLSTSTNGVSSSTQYSTSSSPYVSHSLTQSVSNSSNLSQLGSRGVGGISGDPGGTYPISNDVRKFKTIYIFKTK